MVCRTLPFVERMYYMDLDLYRYTIGREGQSVQDDISSRRYTHHLQIAESCFKSVDLDSLKTRQQKQYMKHELFMLFGIATIFTRLNKSDEADRKLRQMWRNCENHNEKWAKHFRMYTPLTFINIPGKFGQNFTDIIYMIANKVVRFN